MPPKQAGATPVSSLLRDVSRLRQALASTRTPQIRSADSRGHLKAVALAWFQTYKSAMPDTSVTPDIDSAFQAVLTDSERSPSTKKVRARLKKLHADLVLLQTHLVSLGPTSQGQNDVPPSFAVVPDPLMRQILTRRWQECLACLSAGAPLAATVMMGGLLESLFLARINREPNKRPIFTSTTAPKDSKTQKPLSLREWSLKDYIAVSHELGWIPQSVHDVSQVLRDYRNYIHPQKELSHQLALTTADAEMLWTLSRTIALRLL